jgi:predicted permease
MATLLNDLRVAIRQHLRQPGYAVTVICTLGLGIGATAAVFTVVDGVLVRALPYAAPDRLVWVASVRPDNANAPFSLAEFMDYRSRTERLSGLSAYGNWSASLAGDYATDRLQGARVSANTFDLLGSAPIAGRLLHESDDGPEAPPVVVISHRLWQRLFGGAFDIIGRPVRINAESFTVVGVLPPGFVLPILRDIDVVTTLNPEGHPLRHVRNSVNFLRFIGRLGPGTTVEAHAELTGIASALRQQWPEEYARKEAARVVSLHEVLIGDYRQSMLLLLVAVVIVLATALANLMSLALVRANGRTAELTVRTALGASRRLLARQLAAEAALLAVSGSVLGLLVAQQAIALALQWAPTSIPRLTEVGFDGRTVMFIAAIAALVTALLTLAPLGTAVRARARDALRLATRGAIGDRWNLRVRNTMVVGEIAAALVLVVATTLLLKDLRDLQRVDAGFTPDQVFQARVSLPPTYRTLDDVSRFSDRLMERVGPTAGVERVGVISAAPLSGLLRTVPFSVAGQSTAPRERTMANLRAITPGYLDAIGTRLVEGRAFAETDRSETPPVALVSRALADRLLSGQRLGQRLLINDNNSEGPRPIEVVGVVENVRHAALSLPGTMDIYLPFRQVHPDSVSDVRDNQFWMVKTASDPGAFTKSFIEHVRAVDRDAAVSNVGPMAQAVADSLGPRRFNLGLFAAFAATAVLLAIVGLYGLVSYTVSQRGPEIGLRMAIGATPVEVQRMILTQAATLGLLGSALGAGMAAAGRPLVSGLLPTVDVMASSTITIGAALLLLAIVLTAAWWPARRAARTEPTVALRS